MNQKDAIEELRKRCEAICNNETIADFSHFSPTDSYQSNNTQLPSSFSHCKKNNDLRSDESDSYFHISTDKDEQDISNSPEDAFKKIIHLIRVKDRSSQELYERLGKSFEKEAVEEALSRAIDCHLVDDTRYGEALIRTRIREGKGMRGIEYELEKKDISLSLIPGWPDDFFDSESTELERALSFLEKKPPHAKNKRDAAYRKLVQKGFSSSIAADAARSWSHSLE